MKTFSFGIRQLLNRHKLIRRRDSVETTKEIKNVSSFELKRLCCSRDNYLARDGVRFTDLVTPVAATNWNDGELGEDDSSADSGGDFLAALDAQADVAVAVTDGDEGLEASSLTGTGLLLDGHDLQHLVLESAAQEEIDDLELLDRQRV